MTVPAGRVIHTNNFDLLRLLAASQVMYLHAVHHLRPESNGVLTVLTWLSQFFPGVPVFFFMSGFLISWSLRRNKDLISYARNRVLRIYPALWVCFLVSILVVAATGYWAAVPVSGRSFMAWVVAQVTVAQFFNPDFLRGFGVGVLNGSLWTITVELQFYVLLPLIFWGIGRISQRRQLVVLLALILVGLFAEYVLVSSTQTNPESMLVKLFGVTVIPYLHMFLIGALVQVHFERVRPYVEGKALVWVVLYVVGALVMARMTGGPAGAVHMNLVVLVLLYGTVISAAYSWRTLSTRILGKNDVSYGTYIYHMVFVNLLVAMGWTGRVSGVVVAVVATFAVAWVSWVWVEQPALALKRVGARPTGVRP